MGRRLDGDGERATGSIGPDDPTGVGVSCLGLCCGERSAMEEMVEEPPIHRPHHGHGESLSLCFGRLECGFRTFGGGIPDWEKIQYVPPQIEEPFSYLYLF